MRSLAADTRVLSVFVVAGSAIPALLHAIKATHPSRRVGLLTSEASPNESDDFAVERLAHDPAEITKQIRLIADKNIVDHLIIKCDPDAPAIAYASLFLPHDDAGHALTGVASLITTILAVSPSALLDSLLGRRRTEGFLAPCFMAEQIEFAGNIFLDGIQDSPDFKRARVIVSTLNPRAQVLELSSQALDRVLADTRTSFDFAAAVDGARWRKLIDAEERPGADAGAGMAFAYRARKPFHPQKLWSLLQSGFAGVLRAKGFFWLATRNDQVGGLNLAGSEFQVATAGKWWAARDEYVRAEMPGRTGKEWKEPFGDRRQAIAFMGIDFDPNRLNAELDACLLTDLEMAGGEQSWRTLPDPFLSWSGESHHHHDSGHEHDGEEHDCCHH